MSDWFQRHEAAATLVLVVVGLCALSAIYLVAAGQVLAGVGVALVGLGLFGPIRATITGEPTPYRRR